MAVLKYEPAPEYFGIQGYYTMKNAVHSCCLPWDIVVVVGGGSNNKEKAPKRQRGEEVEE